MPKMETTITKLVTKNDPRLGKVSVAEQVKVTKNVASLPPKAKKGEDLSREAQYKAGQMFGSGCPFDLIQQVTGCPSMGEAESYYLKFRDKINERFFPGGQNL